MRDKQLERHTSVSEKPSPFDDLRSQPSSPPPTPALQSELVALFTMPSNSAKRKRYPPRDIPSYRPNYANANMRDQIGRPSFYRGIYCHNCREEGHRNLEWLNDKIARPPSFSLPLSEDDTIEDSTIVSGESYEMSGALPASREKWVQSEAEDNGVYGIAELERCQGGDVALA